MRLAALYLRSRLAGPVLAGIAMAALLAAAAERWLGDEADVMRAALVGVPLVIACLIGAGADSPFGELEQTVSRPLPRFRTVHLAGATVCGSLALLLVALVWNVPDDSGTLVRNLAGLTGLALLVAPLVGGRLAWFAPLIQTVVVIVLTSSDDVGWRVLSWPELSLDSRLATALAATFLAGGLLAISIRGPRLTQDATI